MMNRLVPVGAVVALVVAACGGSDGDDAATSAPDTRDVPADTSAAPDTTVDTAAVAEETTTTVTVADGPSGAACADAEGSGALTEFDEVPCDQAHDAEYASTVPVPDGDAPATDEEFDVAMTGLCLDAVTELLGRPLTGFGFEIAYASGVAPGDAVDGDVDCWLRSPAEDSMVGSLRDLGEEEVLGSYVTLGSVEPGECFLPAPENSGSIGVGTVEDCSTARVDQIVQRIAAPDGPYPGQDALFALGEEQCPAPDDITSFEAIGDTTDVIAVFETEWEVYGARDVICTVYRAADYSDGGPDDGPICFLDDPEGDEASYDEQVSCDEPHSTEFAGFVTPPVDVLPEDFETAARLVRQACRAPVEELAGRDAALPGLGVGFSVSSGLGEPIEEDIQCFAEGRGADLLVGSMASGGIVEAYGDVRIIIDLEPGTCFVFVGGSTDVGEVVDCGAPDALVAIGSFEAELDEYPGLDPLRALRNEVCAGILAESGVAADPATISGTISNREVWEAFDARTITCDATPR